MKSLMPEKRSYRMGSKDFSQPPMKKLDSSMRGNRSSIIGNSHLIDVRKSLEAMRVNTPHDWHP
jgi:hypothetical protein